MRIVLTLGFLASLVFAAQTQGPQAEVDAVTVPQYINYQGFLTNSSGTPLNGNYRINVALYGADSGGITLWSETHDPVTVTRGVFDVVLGSIASLPSVPDNGNLWLQVTVGTEVITPRVRMVSVPYAYHSNNTGRLQGRAVSDAAPSSGQVLKWSGSAWAPAADSAGGGGDTTLWVDQATYIMAKNNNGMRVFDGGGSRVLQVTTSSGTAVYGYTSSASAAAVYGHANNSTSYGVHGHGNYGVYGTGPRNTRGILGVNSPVSGVYGYSYWDGDNAVYGYSYNMGAHLYGVLGSSSRDVGVYGYAQYQYGVYGCAGDTAPASTCAGVYGYGHNYGVYGYSAGGTRGILGANMPVDAGVYGLASGVGGYGAFGRSAYNSCWGALGSDYALDAGVMGYGPGAGQFGVYGWAVNTNASGVYGYCYNNASGQGLYGVLGYGPSDAAVYGYAEAAGDYGVYGRGSDYGTYGYSTAGTWGVLGMNQPVDAGVYGYALYTGDYGVYGYGASTGTYGATFANSSGYYMLICYSNWGYYTNGGKSCVVETEEYGHRALNCVESPGVWFEDFGQARLVDGRAHVELDPVFLQTIVVNGDHPMLVYLTQNSGEPVQAVAEAGRTSFDIIGPPGSSAGFNWRVVAKRVGYEDLRLEDVTDIVASR